VEGKDRPYALGAKMPWSLERFVQGGGATLPARVRVFVDDLAEALR
jgi:hypothetical protein